MNKWYAIYWGVALNLLPLFSRAGAYIPSNFRYQRDFFFLFLASASLLIFGNRIRKYLYPVLSILAYFVFMGFFNQYSPNAKSVWYQFICFGVGSALLIQMASTFKLSELNPILNCLSVAAVINSVFVFFNAFGIDPVYYIGSATCFTCKQVVLISQTTGKPVPNGFASQIYGALGNPNLSASFIAITALSMLRKRAIYWLIVPIAALVLLKSTMGIATLIAGIIVFVGIKYSKKASAIIVMASLAIAANFVPKQDLLEGNGRYPVWKETVNWTSLSRVCQTAYVMQDTSIECYMKRYPHRAIIGKGLGAFHDRFYLHYAKKIADKILLFQQAHNEYIEIFAAFGVIGLILIGYLIYFIRNVRKSAMLSALLVAVLVNSFGHFTFHISSTALLGMIIYAFCVRFSMLCAYKEKIYGTFSY